MSRLSERIVFNGRELDRSVPNAHVIDIVVGPISISALYQDRGMGAGSVFAKTRDGIRNVKVSVELPLDQDAALTYYNRLRAWAASSQPARLVLPGRTNGYLMAVLTEMTDLSMRDFYEPIDLTFTAFSPYFIGAERAANTGSAFNVGGDVGADFKITATIATALTAPTWTIDGSRIIGLTGTVGVGTLTINTETGAVELNGESIKSQINLESRFFALEPGPHIITGPAAAITWSERWR